MKKFKKFIYGAAIAALAALFLYSAGSLILYYAQSAKSQGAYDDLAAMMEQVRPSSPLPTAPDRPNTSTSPTEAPPESPYVTIVHPDTGEEMEILPEYAELFQMNTDLVGWISIYDSMINYPVVQTGTDRTDYYLKRDFYKNYSAHGCIYVREQCDVFAPSDNLTIYGHRMQDNTMFGYLAKYEEKSYWELHPFVRFDTLKHRQLYQIICVFKTTANLGEGFPYHRFENAQTEEEFNDFLSRCKSLALYDTGLTAKYGDKLISLSTCEYTQQNGRLVVLAKRIAQG